MEKARFGYCAVTGDFLHIGHLRFMKKCKDKCENLIVGIMTDECVKQYKGKKPIMNIKDRTEIIKSLSFVYRVYPQSTFEFPHAIMRMKTVNEGDFIIFDSTQHKRKGADILIPYTNKISSTIYKEKNACTNNCKCKVQRRDKRK